MSETAFNYESRVARVYVFGVGCLILTVLIPLGWLGAVWDDGVREANKWLRGMVKTCCTEMKERWTGDSP